MLGQREVKGDVLLRPILRRLMHVGVGEQNRHRRVGRHRDLAVRVVDHAQGVSTTCMVGGVVYP
jgi:hypothetical protein